MDGGWLFGRVGACAGARASAREVFAFRSGRIERSVYVTLATVHVGSYALSRDASSFSTGWHPTSDVRYSKVEPVDSIPIASRPGS